MSQGPGGREPSQRQAEIEAAAEATAVAVHRFLVEINRAVGTLREDLDVATEYAQPFPFPLSQFGVARQYPGEVASEQVEPPPAWHGAAMEAQDQGLPGLKSNRQKATAWVKDDESTPRPTDRPPEGHASKRNRPD
ncbi:hypothetical protein ACKKBG_A36885 [Auxenochlorella protothecoides x Auxenochlorella symbiontica]